MSNLRDRVVFADYSTSTDPGVQDVRGAGRADLTAVRSPAIAATKTRFVCAQK
jgi:hypothetical protein